MSGKVERRPAVTDAVASQITPLTSVRFFAALFVVLFHGWVVVPSHQNQHNLLSRTISYGYISVSFFFMLSGFILAIVYLRPGKPIRLKRFFLSRFARIYPLYLVAVLIDVPRFLHVQRSVLHRPHGQTAETVLATLGLVQAWFPTLHNLDGPSWSLSAEAFFYLLFPFLGVFLSRLSGIAVLVLSVGLYVGGMGLVVGLHSTGQTYSPFPYLFIFVLGIALARVYGWIRESPERGRVLALSAPGMIIVSLGTLFTIPLFSLTIPEPLLQHGLAAPMFALMILALSSDCRAITRPLSTGWLVVLGEASFSLYLIHQPIMSMLRRPIQHFGTAGFLVYLALIVGLSVLSLRFLETPVRLRILARQRVVTPEGAVTSALA